MKRLPGKPRKLNPKIPAHIDQSALPKGIYWRAIAAGGWYVYDVDAAGKRTTKTVALAGAKLSELHEIMESRRHDGKGSLRWLMTQFHDSAKYIKLAASTRRDYDHYRRVADKYPTKRGPLGEIMADSLTSPIYQRIVDKLADEGTPTKANHLLRYLRRVYSWGITRGHCKTNPLKGLEQAEERGKKAMPQVDAQAAVLRFARERGSLKAHSKGSVSPYLWIVMQLTFLVRARGIEALMLTDAHATVEGVLVSRTKGSRDTIVEWDARLREAWDAAVEYRKSVLPANTPIPIDPAARFLIVAQDGQPLRKSSLDSAWQRMIHAAIAEKIITPEQRFSLHGLKHRGITDTDAADKQRASGHKTKAMTDHYDHEIAVVGTPKVHRKPT